MNPSSLAGHAVELLDRIVRSALPSDRVIQDFYRERRYLGSHDRRWITERAYGIVRNYRLLRESAAGCASHLGPIQLFVAHEMILEGTALEELEQKYQSLFDSYKMSGEGFDLREMTDCIRSRHAELAASNAGKPLLFSFPDFFPELLPRSIGAEAVPLMVALNREARVCIRVDTNKMSREDAAAAFEKAGIETDFTRYSPFGLNLSKRVNLNNDRLYKEGIVEVQEEASQLVGLLVAPGVGETIVDACAGAGGKSLEIAALAGGKCDIYALDVDESRLRNLVTRARRNGYAGIVPVKVGHDDLGDAGKLTGIADKVVVDAPCSGSGTIRRNPDKKFRLDRETVDRHANYQLKLLRQYAELVRPGGVLVYSTCSIFAEENADVVEAFVGGDERFALGSVSEYLKSGSYSDLIENGYLATYPHRHNIDGFFAAVMKRSS